MDGTDMRDICIKEQALEEEEEEGAFAVSCEKRRQRMPRHREDEMRGRGGASPWDRWRINGPARMKGTVEEGVENPFSFSRVYPSFAAKDVSLSLSRSLARLVGQFLGLSFLIFFLILFFSLSLSLSHLSILSERLRSSQIREPIAFIRERASAFER
ncbi:hypothetical protein ALC57_06014 [Trachymyrmex cornetzi]|uniref:Uncharacterized protein n=1 Tax=Trachymyrmex cornetzi TaxID=471704 RepID=A0A151J995_9HYME|nr:hypothetical protein ALC57_06014 [Trachymyrmex cornetzi]